MFVEPVEEAKSATIAAGIRSAVQESAGYPFICSNLFSVSVVL